MKQNKIANLLLLSGVLLMLFYCLSFGITSNSWWMYFAIFGGYYSPVAMLAGFSMKVLGFIDKFRK